MPEWTHDAARRRAEELPLGELMDLVLADPDFARALNTGETGNPVTVQAIPSAADMVEELITNASRSGDKWLKRLKTPSDDPRTAGVRAAKKWQNELEDAFKDGSYAKGVGTYDLDAALDTAEKVGRTAYQASFEPRRRKIQAKFDKLQPLLAAVTTKVRGEKQDTEADRDNRALMQIRGMREAGKKLKGA